MSVTYPLFVFEKDEKSMLLVKEEGQILQQLEAIDIENDEYVFWDVSGGGVSVAVLVGAFKGKLKSVTSCSPAFPIRDAFISYARTLGLPEAIAEGAPVDVWRRIQTELDVRLRKRSFLSKLFSG